MGRFGEQPQGEVLPDHQAGQEGIDRRGAGVAEGQRHHGAFLGPARRIVMKALRRGWRRLLGSLSREKSDLSDELQSHLEMQIDDNLRAGMLPDEARREARLKFGGIDSTKESYRDQRGLPWLETT